MDFLFLLSRAKLTERDLTRLPMYIKRWANNFFCFFFWWFYIQFQKAFRCFWMKSFVQFLSIFTWFSVCFQSIFESNQVLLEVYVILVKNFAHFWYIFPCFYANFPSIFFTYCYLFLVTLDLYFRLSDLDEAYFFCLLTMRKSQPHFWIKSVTITRENLRRPFSN